MVLDGFEEHTVHCDRPTRLKKANWLQIIRNGIIEGQVLIKMFD